MAMRKRLFFPRQPDEPNAKKAPNNSQKKMEVLGAFRVRSNLTAESLQQKLKSVAYKFTVWVIVTGPMPSKKALSETSTEVPAPEGTPPEYPLGFPQQGWVTIPDGFPLMKTLAKPSLSR
jgi:hypothetical protein